MRKILFLLLLAFPCTSRIAAQDIHFIGKRSVDTCHAKANCKNPILWKLKTNLLYDAFVVPNISADMHLGRNWSAGLGFGTPGGRPIHAIDTGAVMEEK